MATQHAVSAVATEGGDFASFKAIFVFMQTRVRKQILIIVELTGENSIFYGWETPGYLRTARF
jgi:hypothetical protein